MFSNFKSNGIQTSLFIDPQKDSIDVSKEVGASLVELHTGKYSNLFNSINIENNTPEISFLNFFL